MLTGWPDPTGHAKRVRRRRRRRLRGVDAGFGLGADGVDRPLHEPAGRLGGDSELLADLAVAALAAVVDAEALLHRVPGAGVEHVEEAGGQLLFGPGEHLVL